MDGRQAFWSYVHQDDKDDGGRIGDLSRLLRARVRLLTGADFPIFLDRDSLGWGEEWETKIREALLSTMFFVPIITPSYFRSEACREELVIFSASALALGLKELILPIYYTPVAEFDAPPPSGDELVDLVRRYQWEDWTEVGLEDQESSLHRKSVDRLARKLIASAASADSKPSRTPTSTSRATFADDEDDDDDDREGDGSSDHGSPEAPGQLDILEAGEAAFERLGARLNEVPTVITIMGQQAEHATKELARSDEQGKGFAGRLTVARRLAKQLEEQAGPLEQLASGYLQDILAVDSMVNIILETLRDQPSQVDEMAEFLDSIEQLTGPAEEGLSSLSDLAQTLRDNAKWSKDLRRPSNRIERALRQMADTRTLFRQWQAQINDLRAEPSIQA